MGHFTAAGAGSCAIATVHGEAHNPGMKTSSATTLLLPLFLAFGTPSHAQDPVELVLQSAPATLGLAGSPENFSSLVEGLTAGTPVRLAAAGPAGFERVITFTPRGRLSAEQAAARLEQVRRDFDLLGIARPTPEQLATALVGGVLDTPTGRTTLGAPTAPVRSALAPSARQPTPEEQAVAALPEEIRAVVSDLPPKQALRTVELADQQLVALGTPYASAERRRQMVQRLRYGTGYTAASAGATSFPPLSPLVAAPLWQP